MNHVNSKKRFKELGNIVEIPDLYLWVYDDGTWGVGELVIVDARNWTNEQFEQIADCPARDRWNLAVAMASATNNPPEEGDKQ